MATIEDLKPSITQLSREDLTRLIMDVRANRRTRPTKAAKKAKANARVKRKTARKKAPTQADLFAMVESMTPEQKLKIANAILKRS